MTKAHDTIGCPICGTELTLAQIITHEDARLAFARLVAVSVPVGALVMQYITLFAPPKTRLTIPKQARLVLQLVPDLERQAITHKGREWLAPLPAWGQAIEQMMGARDAGRLELPLSGHGYLYAVLAGLADKREGAMERQREAERRGPPPRQDTVQVRGHTMSIGQGLDTVYGGRDPALAKIENDGKAAAPMPDAVRERLAVLRKPRPPEGDGGAA